MDGIQYIPIAHDFVFVPISGRCFFLKKLLHSRTGRNDTLNFVGRSRALDLGKLLSSSTTLFRPFFIHFG